MKKKMDVSDVVKKIEKLTKSRISSQEVVSLDQFRTAQQKLDPKVLLVIEDDETMRNSLKRIFEPEGFLLKLAADSSELARVMGDEGIDLIIMDVGLPWINGFELAQLLREHKDLQKIPLIFVSGQATDEDIKRAFAVGASDFIRKPFDIEKLKRSVATLLKMVEK